MAGALLIETVDYKRESGEETIVQVAHSWLVIENVT